MPHDEIYPMPISAHSRNRLCAANNLNTIFIPHIKHHRFPIISSSPGATALTTLNRLAMSTKTVPPTRLWRTHVDGSCGCTYLKAKSHQHSTKFEAHHRSKHPRSRRMNSSLYTTANKAMLITEEKMPITEGKNVLTKDDQASTTKRTRAQMHDVISPYRSCHNLAPSRTRHNRAPSRRGRRRRHAQR